MVYHELRSPLALMATAARSAAEESSDEYVRSRCESIVRAAERMLRTASHLIDVAGATQHAEQAEFDPARVVEEVVQDYRAMGTAIVLEIVDRGRLAYGVVQHLEALLCSLLGNASDHGDRTVPLHVVVQDVESRTHITIRNAIGGEIHHRGLGLGVYIGQQLASNLGATLRTWSTTTEHNVEIELAAN